MVRYYNYEPPETYTDTFGQTFHLGDTVLFQEMGELRQGRVVEHDPQQQSGAVLVQSLRDASRVCRVLCVNLVKVAAASELTPRASAKALDDLLSQELCQEAIEIIFTSLLSHSIPNPAGYGHVQGM